ncbi:unnamed protein product [Chrysoparadoxa australica]
MPALTFISDQTLRLVCSYPHISLTHTLSLYGTCCLLVFVLWMFQVAPRKASFMAAAGNPLPSTANVLEWLAATVDANFQSLVSLGRQDPKIAELLRVGGMWECLYLSVHVTGSLSFIHPP